MIKNILFYLFLGLRDASRIYQSVQRYLEPQTNDQSLPEIRINLKINGISQDINTYRIEKHIIKILIQSGTFSALIYMLNSYYSAIWYWLIMGLFYLISALFLGRLLHDIGEEAISMEVQIYRNTGFMNLDRYTSYEKKSDGIIDSFIDALIKGIIHGIIELFTIPIETTIFLLGLLICKFFLGGSIISIPIFALYLSYFNRNPKIPHGHFSNPNKNKENPSLNDQDLNKSYQTPSTQVVVPKKKDKIGTVQVYNLHSHLPYLIGFNLLQSCILHFTNIQTFVVLQFALQPFFLLNLIAKEPPRIIMMKKQSLYKTLWAILMDDDTQLSEQLKIQCVSYKEYIKGQFIYQDLKKIKTI